MRQFAWRGNFGVIAALLGLMTMWDVEAAFAQSPPAPPDTMHDVIAETLRAAGEAMIIADAEFDRGVRAQNDAQYEEASVAYAKALQARPIFPAATFNRAICYIRRKQWELALQDLNVIIKNKKWVSRVPDAFLLRAQVYGALKRYDEQGADVVEYWERTRDTPDIPDAKFILMELPK